MSKETDATTSDTSVATNVSFIEKAIADTHRTVDASIAPVRETALRRYPTLFAIFATVGAAMTFLGLEQVLLHFSVFNRHPVLLLMSGVVILVVTGRLYKKLS